MTHDPDQPTHDPAPPVAALNPGDSLGPYRIIQELGASEASAAWKAQDTRDGKAVVIRQLIPGSPASREIAFLERCQREVVRQQALAGKVRRVVLFKELFGDPRGAFVVTDFVSGASVEQLLASRGDPFDLVRGLRIVHATANVLEQTHAQGLIHGGLKPSNILLRLSGGVQVADAGLTALIAEQEALSPKSARYMAPELFHGVAPDARSDIYSLGMIAYEMLAGRGAFEQSFAAVLSDPRNPALRWMKWHTNARVKPISLYELNPRVPVRLSDLVTRMMEKDRSKRIASAEQLLQAILRHFGDKAIKQAEVSPDAFTPSGAQISATGPGDTTELPTRSKVPMVVSAVVVVLAVILGGVWLTVSTIKSRALASRRAEAASQLDRADDLYVDGKFDLALKTYREQSLFWPDTGDELGLHAQAGTLLTQAQLDLASGDYAASRASLNELGRLDEAGPADRQAVKTLSDEIERRRAFEVSVASIHQFMEAGSYAQAKAEIQQARDSEPTEQETQALVELQVLVDARLKQEKIEQALARAEELINEDNLAGAISHLQDEQKHLQSPHIEDLLAELSTRQQIDEALDRGETAQSNGDLAGALRAFEEALALREDEALSRQVLKLKSQIAVEDGKAKSEAGDELGARHAFTEALGYDPDNAQARGWLARMDVQLKKQALIEAGQRAEISGELAAAAGHYREALKHGDDPELEQVLRSVEVRLLLTRADRLMASGQLPLAQAALNQASRLDPDNPAIDDALGRYDRRSRYRDLLHLGDEHVGQGRFAQAKQAYRQARDVLDTDEIKQRLDDTEFKHLIAQARGYIDSAQWSSARGILNTAARIRITEELSEMRRQVQEHLDAAE